MQLGADAKTSHSVYDELSALQYKSRNFMMRWLKRLKDIFTQVWSSAVIGDRSKIANTENSRQMMSSELTAGLASGSIDASLAEVDARIKEPNRLHNAAFDIGSFSVFSSSDSSTHGQFAEATRGQNTEPSIDFASTSISDLDSLLDVGNVFGWNDLFDTGLDFTSPSHEEQSNEKPLALLARVASQPFDMQYSDNASHLTRLDTFEPVNPQIEDIAPPSYGQIEMTDIEVLSHGQILLRYFKDVIIPTYSPLPIDSKSPWEIMNCYAAIQTLADMTYLENPYIKYANRANLFGALACSAYTIAESRIDLAGLPAFKCQQIANHASMRAKKHMQDSLRTETRGTFKARYKDQLMAIHTLIALTIFHFLCYRDAINLTILNTKRESPRCSLLSHRCRAPLAASWNDQEVVISTSATASPRIHLIANCWRKHFHNT